MKVVFLICFFFASLCFQPHDVKVLEATSRAFYMGREESGAGVEYRIRVKVYKGSEILSINRVWVGSKAFVPEVKKVAGVGGKYRFQKGDELLITFVDWINKPNDFPGTGSVESQNHPSYKGAGLIKYKTSTKEGSVLISDFRKLPEEVGL